MRTADQNGELFRITGKSEVDTLLDALMATPWVVYSKACLHRTETVVKYLAQYSHRIAISNWRIVGIEGDQVTFRYKNYRDHHRNKTMPLSDIEFIRRFLIHVLPKGLMRIRHFGFLANHCRAPMLEKIRAWFVTTSDVSRTLAISAPQTPKPIEATPCPKCHQGHLQVVWVMNPKRLTGGSPM